MAIEVPRDKKDSKVTRDIENLILDIIAGHPEEPFHFKEILARVRAKYAGVHGWDLEAHTSYALDMIHTNNLIKRVAPNTYESPEGPDDVYSERATGHAPEGEFVGRGRDFTGRDTSGIKNKTEWNHELSKADLSVKMLKNMGKGEEAIEEMLLSSTTPFNRVAVKVALKKYFHGMPSE